MKYEKTYGRKAKEIALIYSRSTYCNRCGINKIYLKVFCDNI